MNVHTTRGYVGTIHVVTLYILFMQVPFATGVAARAHQGQGIVRGIGKPHERAPLAQTRRVRPQGV
jgi:hypothetical protein